MDPKRETPKLMAAAFNQWAREACSFSQRVSSGRRRKLVAKVAPVVEPQMEFLKLAISFSVLQNKFHSQNFISHLLYTQSTAMALSKNSICSILLLVLSICAEFGHSFQPQFADVDESQLVERSNTSFYGGVALWVTITNDVDSCPAGLQTCTTGDDGTCCPEGTFCEDTGYYCCPLGTQVSILS